jgi:hypothetical protein
MSRFEAHIDRMIREAQKRGDFDDLPGAGKPLPDRGELYDETWWLKQWIARENLTGLAPTTLRVRKEIEDLGDTVARLGSEALVRGHVADLNRRIDEVIRGHADGPPVVVRPVEVEEVVRAWKARRNPPM